MTNLINLGSEREKRDARNEPEMWCCDCGCVTFYHWSNGAIQCADCKVVQNGYTAPITPAG